MKTDKYQPRFYRDWVNVKDLFLERVVYQETDLQILTDKPLDQEFIQERIRTYRRQIEIYISKDRRFLTSLKPIAVELKTTPIIREMSRAARKANVGPMAAVAGAIAQFLGKDLLRKGYKEIIIENGGDIFLVTRKIRKVAIYSGTSLFWKSLKLKIRPQDTPLGICTSSGKVGHSLSFGSAESVVILSKNASLADAVATATGNLVNSKADLQKAIAFACSIKGVCAAVIIFKNSLASWGKVEFMS
ncbi:MAG: UPF0280 family protein [Deltaproteobacteria bacterium]